MKDIPVSADMSGLVELGIGGSSASASDGILRLPPDLSVWWFDTAEDLADIPSCDLYLQPSISNYPAIDAIVICGKTAHLFQIVRNKNRSINADVCKVLAFLPPQLEVQWIWVLPRDTAA